jgi:hypothetical protein
MPKAVSAADGGAAADSSDEEEMIQPRFSWAAALINRFGESGGFDALQQVRTPPPDAAWGRADHGRERPETFYVAQQDPAHDHHERPIACGK